MNPVPDKLRDYLREVSGEEIQLDPVSGASFPLFLRDRYQLLSGKLFGRDFILAVEKTKGDPISAGVYESHSELLRSKSEEPVVFVPGSLPTYLRNRMVQLGIPFIVPGSQLFLPMVLIDLRERRSPAVKPMGDRFTPAAQSVLLYHLIRESISGWPMHRIAEATSYSAIMMTKVRAEFEAAEMGESVRKGRTTALRFHFQGRELWERALPFLSSPVRKQHWVHWGHPGDPALIAGITALSANSLLSDARLPTYALWHKSFQANLESGLYRSCRDPDEANASIQAWNYDPKVLGNDHRVDPLSLYLSLMGNPDERVQQQLPGLLEEVPS